MIVLGSVCWQNSGVVLGVRVSCLSKGCIYKPFYALDTSALSSCKNPVISTVLTLASVAMMPSIPRKRWKPPSACTSMLQILNDAKVHIALLCE